MIDANKNRNFFGVPISPRPFFLVALVLVTFWLVDFHGSESLRFQIIDARSGVPIQNAIVSVDWQINKPRFFHGTERYPFRVTEQRTDYAGRVTISAWRKPAISLFGSSINFRQPSIRILARSYVPLRMYDIGDNQAPVERKLKMISTQYISPEEYLEALNDIADDLSRLRNTGKCAWKKTPQFLADLENLRAELSDHGVVTRIPPLETLGGPVCGNAIAFVKEYTLTDQGRTDNSVD